MSQPPEIIPSSIPIPTVLVKVFSYLWFYIHKWFLQIPGAPYVISYIRKSHQDDPYRTAFEFALIVYGVVYFLNKPKKKGAASLPQLSERDVDSLIDEWEPEPLVHHEPRQKWRLDKIPVIQGSGIENYVNITRGEGKESYSNVFNCASNNFLQLSENPSVLNEVKKTIKNYGVGACGPAGFYGNQDVHNTLEYDLARFFGTENTVLYGQDFCVAASVLPAFTKRGDVLVADDGVSISLQNALQLARSTVYYFRHNDMDSLESLLRELNEREERDRSPALPRRFIVTEGLFHNSGDIAPLPQLVRLKSKYKYRLFIDETYSLGVLGSTGRGLTEHFNMNRDKVVDITLGSMATALGSSGAFVLGDNVMSHHQRIGSAAYCFSASLPPYTTRAVSKVLELMDEDSTQVARLQSLSRTLHNFFANDDELRKFIEVFSSEHSSVLHLRLTPEFRRSKFDSSEEQIFDRLRSLQNKCVTDKYIEEYEKEEEFLQLIVDITLQQSNVLITRNTIAIKHETLPITPSLKICCNASMSEQELLDACHAVKQATLQCCA